MAEYGRIGQASDYMREGRGTPAPVVPRAKTANVRVSKTTIITLAGTSINARELLDALQDCTDLDVVRINYYKSDSYDQREYDYATLTITREN